MKTSSVVLLLSVAANAVLGAVWISRVTRASVSDRREVATSARIETARATLATEGSDKGVPSASFPSAAIAAGGDEAVTVARLRAEGFPTNLLYELVKLRVRERHAAELRKFRPPADYAYWRENPLTNDPPPADRPARRTLERQIAAEIKELLGPEVDRGTVYERANRERLYGPLSVEKVDQLVALNKDYGEVAAAIRDRADGIILQEDRNQLAFLERERRAELAALLTPAELLEYDLRASPSASTVRSRLGAFEATEEEFRDMTAMQLAFDAIYGSGNLSAAEQEKRQLATMELQAQMKTLISPARLAEYEIKTDPAYRSVSDLVSRYSTPADAVAIVSAQRELAEQFNALRRNRTLPAAQRDAQLDILAVEANKRMAAALGPEAFLRYKSTGGPINALLNRPPPKP